MENQTTCEGEEDRVPVTGNSGISRAAVDDFKYFSKQIEVGSGGGGGVTYIPEGIIRLERRRVSSISRI